MSQALRTMTKDQQIAAVRRRLIGPEGGNGYNAARDAARKLGIALPSSGGNGRPKKIKRRPSADVAKIAAMIDDSEE